jgi:hypothetical protein
VKGYRRSPALTIRWAEPEDADRLAILAELDQSAIPPPPLLLGFVADELWVAASIRTGAVVSDPFRPSADVAALVLERGRHLTVPESKRPRRDMMRLGTRRLPANTLGARAARRLGGETRA